MLQITLIGAGRVAGLLGPALVRAGHQVPYVWSRTLPSATALAATLPGAEAGTSLALHLRPASDLYLLAVPDAAVPAVLAAAQFPPGALVAHTAGALPLSVFAPYSGVRGGVFYPLQTFSAGRQLDWPAVPLCIEAADAAGEATLLALAHSLSQQVARVATPQRQALHVAAVFACNFTNHLFGISQALLTEAALPFHLLMPLIRETVEKAAQHPPFTVQTGPAARHDAPTLDQHRATLAAHPEWQRIYNLLTDSIQAQASALAANNQQPV